MNKIKIFEKKIILMNPKIYFKLNKKYNIPGNYIDGDLLIYNFIFVGIKSLKIKFIGTIIDKIEKQYSIENIDYIPYEIVNTNYEYCFYNKKLNKNKNNDFNLLLEPKIHNFKIQYPIDEINLPQTYNDENYSISYKLCFIIEFVDIYSSYIKKAYYDKKINIIPLIYTFEKILNIPFITPNIEDNYIIYSAFIPHKGFIKNDIIKIVIKILNYKKINFNKIIINIRLQEKIINKKKINYILKYIYNYKKIFILNDILNYENIIKIEDFQIPSYCNYNILSNTTNHIFEIINEIVITIKLLNNHKKIVLKNIVIPILIGTFRYKEDINFNDIPEIPFYE